MIKVIIFILSLNVFAFENLEEKQEIAKFFWDKNHSILTIDIHHYIRNLAKKVADTDYDFFVIDDNNINAFATEYGLIGINKGLIDVTENESELAAVIAHEIAHIKLEHFSRFAKKTSHNRLLLIGGILLASLSKNSEVNQALITTGLASNTQMGINFTRSHEVEADNHGEMLLKSSVFDNNAMSHFFTKLQEDKNALEFLNTHPPTQNRMANSFMVGTHQAKHQSSFEYLITKAILNPQADIISSNEKVAAYIKAMDYFKLNQYQATLNTLERFDNLAINILKARALAHLGHLKKAISYLTGEDELSRYYLAQAYFINKKYPQALRVIREQNYKKPSIYNYRLISDIELKLDNHDKFHYNQGMAFLLMSENYKAKKQFMLAQSKTQNQDLLLVLKYKIQNSVK